MNLGKIERLAFFISNVRMVITALTDSLSCEQSNMVDIEVPGSGPVVFYVYTICQRHFHPINCKCVVFF